MACGVVVGEGAGLVRKSSSYLSSDREDLLFSLVSLRSAVDLYFDNLVVL